MGQNGAAAGLSRGHRHRVGRACLHVPIMQFVAKVLPPHRALPARHLHRYEEEPEYDAITELLPPKRVYLCSPQQQSLPTQRVAQSAEAQQSRAGSHHNSTSDPDSGSSFQTVQASLQGLAMTCGFTSSLVRQQVYLHHATAQRPNFTLSCVAAPILSCNS